MDDLENRVISRGCFSQERNKEIYDKWFKNSPRYLFRATDEQYGISKMAFCDVGCSYGMNLLTNPNSYGIDIVSDYVDFAKSIGLKAYLRNVGVDSLDDLPKVEAVWCCAVPEHVDSPHLFLLQLRSLLKPGGLVFVWVPTIPPFPWLRYIPGLKKHVTAHTHSDHINAFTPRTIRFTAERAGFDTIELNAMYPFPFRWLGKFLFLLDGVMYVGRRREQVYFGNSTRKGKEVDDKPDLAR
ncbi:MAG: methyltransferase domain-containing protein [Candidatus Pacebacteria bacterium]|nr:methyltransferase domain-containing protein [Candidatus Paceibacterota bacterium]